MATKLVFYVGSYGSLISRLGQKKNICLFKLPRPTLIFTPDPKSFYGIWETQEGNVVPVYLHTNLASVCTKRGVFNTQKVQFKTKKTSHALNN